MKILLANSSPYIPQKSGGAQSSMHDLAMELIKRGHEVSVLAGLTGQGWLGLKSRAERKLMRREYAVDHGLGYPVYRTWFPWKSVAQIAKDIRADIVVPQSGFPAKFVRELLGLDTRIVVYLRNVEVEDLGGDLRDLQGVSYVSNSKFTSQRWKDLFGIESDVVYPLIRRENYETETTRENVTFINPHPLKGLEIALGAAEQCPDIPFVFVESWGIDPQDEAQRSQRLASLPNVTLRPRTRDMKSVYGKARIVIAPSQWEEAFGRVGVEPQFSGIPVIASARGGLPEAVGPGGILMDPEADADAWAEAIRKLWHDPALYAAKSQAALVHADRAEMNPTYQIDRLLKIFAKKG